LTSILNCYMSQKVAPILKCYKILVLNHFSKAIR
jgi:hypothetical protein